MNKKDEILLQRITVNPAIMGGKPIIRGMRFPVADILQLLASGMTTKEILGDFPYLEPEDITASLLYAGKKIDHPILAVALHEA